METVLKSCSIIQFMQMEVEEEKRHEGIQQYYITKIEALQVQTCGCWFTMYTRMHKAQAL